MKSAIKRTMKRTLTVPDPGDARAFAHEWLAPAWQREPEGARFAARHDFTCELLGFYDEQK